MEVEVDKLIEDVRVAIDLNRRNDSLEEEGDPETLETDEIIRGCICESIDQVHLDAPVWMLESQNLPTDFQLDGKGCGKMTLPSDFLRLVAFKMSDWGKAVFEVFLPGELGYEKQQSRWKGIYGNPQDPALTVEPGVSGLILKSYSSSSSGALEYALYVPMARIESGKVKISQKCYKAAVNHIGALVLATLGENNSQTLMEMRNSILTPK